MCQNLTLIAQDDDCHYVGVCEHGTVHLVWAHLSLHLRANEFVALADTVVAACLEAGPPPDSPAVSFRMKIGETRVEMDTEPFWRLADLMRRGSTHIAARPGFRPARRAAWVIEVAARSPRLTPRMGLN